MKKGEYWLLHSAIEQTCPFGILLSERIEMFYNRTGHGLSKGELVDVLCHILERGDLQCERGDDGIWTRDNFPPTPQEIERRLSNEVKSNYGLTARGGARWEEYANPDWNKYLVSQENDLYADPTIVSLSQPGLHKARVFSMNSSLIDRYLHSQFHPFFTVELLDTQPMELVVSWEATYWKTLPQAYCMRYIYFATDRDPLFEKEQDREEERRQRRRLKTWYTDPL